MPKHTPGPWYVTASDVDGHMVVDGSHGIARWPMSGGTPEAVANARLIASAPDLLAALEALLISEESPHSETVRYLAREDARRAIARATGEE